MHDVDLVNSGVAAIAEVLRRIVAPGAGDRLAPSFAGVDVHLTHGPVEFGTFGQFAPRGAVGRHITPLMRNRYDAAACRGATHKLFNVLPPHGERLLAEHVQAVVESSAGLLVMQGVRRAEDHHVGLVSEHLRDSGI